MTLQKILIQNFQPHAKCKIEFDSKITTITGDTDAGKSSIFRALRWLCLNQPRGDSFIRHGSDGTTIKAIFDDCSVVRKLGKGINLYQLDGKDLNTPGTSVPEPIANALLVSDLNFQDQHDESFWLAISAGEVSRQLNSIVDLGIIDTTLANAQKNLKTCQGEVKFCKSRLDKAKIALEDLQWVVEADKSYKEVENLRMDFLAASSRIQDLQVHIQAILVHQRVIQEKDRRYQQICEIGKIAKTARDAEERVGLLRSTIQKIEQCKAKIVEVPSTKDLDRIVEVYNRMEMRQEVLQRSISVITKLTENYVSLDRKANQFQGDLERRTDGVCPMCGRDLEEDMCLS